MRRQAVDPIILGAQKTLRSCAERVAGVRAELEGVLRDLRQHPDYIRSARADRVLRKGEPFGPHNTLAWWLYDNVYGLLHESSHEIAGLERLLRMESDLGWLKRSMRESIEIEARDRKQFAKRRGAA